MDDRPGKESREEDRRAPRTLGLPPHPVSCASAPAASRISMFRLRGFDSSTLWSSPIWRTKDWSCRKASGQATRCAGPRISWRGGPRRLFAAGWQIRPNLHFSHVQKHVVWASTDLPVSEYLDYFRENPNEIGRANLAKVPLAELIARWTSLRLISASDAGKLQRAFGETQRSFA
jgi:hypothetical protein